MGRTFTRLAFIEALAALGILALVLMAFPALSVTALQRDRLAACRKLGTTLTQEKYEEIRNTPFEHVTTGADAGALTVPGAVTGCTYRRSWIVTTGPTSMTKQVTISVHWQPETAPRSRVW